MWRLLPIDYTMNHLPGFEPGLVLGSWQKPWSVLIRMLHEIDQLSHYDDFESDEPNLEDPLNLHHAF